MAESLVSCEWLKEQLDKGNQNIRILDGTWNQAAWKRDAEQEYRDGHISGAVRFDIATVANKEIPQPLMLPPPEQFEKQVGEMGITNETHVVIYDNHTKFGFYSGGRVWWMFKIFGHDKVSLLDGGLPKWISNGYPVVKGPQEPVTATSFKVTFVPTLLRDMQQVKEALETKKEQVVDGRPKGRYDGTAPEPNPKLRSGHMLGSICLPFTAMVDPDTKTLKSKDGLREAFESVGVKLDQPILLTCGGAVVAPFLGFALYQLGITVPVYDGSWSEWVQKAPDETKHLGVKGEDL